MNRTRFFLLSAMLPVIVAGCESRDGADPAGDPPAMTTQQPAGEAAAGGQDGTATVYAGLHEGRQTASGESFSHEELMAAHHTHEMGSSVRVTNLENNRSVTVRIADRMGQGSDAIIDLSRRAARELGMDEGGTARVRVAPQ